MKNINSIHPDKHSYLQALECVSDISETLYYIGNLPEARRVSVAIVGTRKPSSYGKEVTYRFAHELASRGIVVVSGLAHGIDGIAHTAALDAGGTTIAVVAHGLDTLYPAAHRQLAERIVSNGGAIVSEYPVGTSARQHHFLQRNRIVSGLSDGIIITEAAARSGTLNTAAHALEQGKDVYVVPGNITQPLSAGCNQLLLQGATPLLSTSQIFETLLPNDASQQTSLPLGANDLENDIIALIAGGERDGEVILAKLSASSAEFSTALTMLEINGIIRGVGANQWTLCG